MAADLKLFGDKYLKKIPFLDFMQARATSWDGKTMRFDAPLMPSNVNDKGFGFAGSLGTMASVAGWSVITLMAEDAGFDIMAVIKQNQMQFFKPVQSDFYALAHAEDEDKGTFIASLKQKKRGKLPITVSLFDKRRLCAQQQAEYVGLVRDDGVSFV
ncbi:MAG: hypothetical protein GY807_12890 [Gammaproteobacteria bacterium]|nr:hypothetical protein [Gammaproteobacteria bacterium]